MARKNTEAAYALARAAIEVAKASVENQEDEGLYGRTAEQIVAEVVEREGAATVAAATKITLAWLDDEAAGWAVGHFATLANTFVESDEQVSAPTRAEPDRRLVWLRYDAGRGGRHGVAITGKGAASRFRVLDGRKRTLATFDDAETAGREAADMLEEHLDPAPRDGETHHWRRAHAL